MFGNYAGDVLHFGLACERLRAEGIPAKPSPSPMIFPAHRWRKKRSAAA
jgi:hypothetical protein